MYVLDTNVVSELRKVRSGRANPGVAEWIAEAPTEELFISVVTLHELELGVLLAERSDPAKGALLRQWLDGSVGVAFTSRILTVDTAVARRAAALHVPDPAGPAGPAPFRDGLIAASALERGMGVVTRNERDFVRFAGLEVVNPWS